MAQLLQSERVADVPYILYGRGYHTTGQVSPNESANYSRFTAFSIRRLPDHDADISLFLKA